jgi:twitching motility protein PilT
VARSGPEALERYLGLMAERGASDLHLSTGERPILRVDGELVRMEEEPVLTGDSLWALLRPLMPDRLEAEWERGHDVDFAHEITGLARYRCNYFLDRLGPGAVFRIIPAKILTAEDLSLSAYILRLCRLTKGLVLVTGPTGSGKSTTLTALVDYINRLRRDHVITIEDPIEFVHANQSCLINQREVGVHTDSFKVALRAALREDPDIILVGEMRDLETVSIALETAETGHLVFGTLHTSTAVSTVDRIIDQFPADHQSQVRVMLAESLRGVIAQTLCRRKKGGRVAALEVLIGIPAVANLIREGKTFQIPSLMQTGRKYGMTMLNDALLDLLAKGTITAEEAYLRAVEKTGMASALKSRGADLSFLEGEDAG